jgi:segregation and condensation protein A
MNAMSDEMTATASGASQLDYRVDLEAYHGPLDLLLYLVKRHEIDLYDIPIAQLTEQYLTHLRLIEQIDMDLAGEFLVMAATLLEIKSQMLVPQAGSDESADGSSAPGDANDEGLSITDPRYELVQQLLAYKKFKDAAFNLDLRWEDWQARFAATPKKFAKADETVGEVDETSGGAVEIDLEDVNVLDLCAAFSRILDSIGQRTHHEVVYDDTPIALHAEDILDRLQRDGRAGRLTLAQVFEGRGSRSEMIGLFLATLELVRQRRVRVFHQAAPVDAAPGNSSVTPGATPGAGAIPGAGATPAAGDAIVLELVPQAELEAIKEIEDQPADWRDPTTGHVQYDWPDPQAKARHEARQRRKAQALARMHGQPGSAPVPGSSSAPGRDGDAAAGDGEDDDLIELDLDVLAEGGGDEEISGEMVDDSESPGAV